MRKYEVVILLNAKLDNDSLDQEINKFKDFVEARGVSSVVCKKWGRKELAYNMAGQDWAHYCSVEFATENTAVTAEITSNLRINDLVVKFEIHKAADCCSCKAAV